MHRQKRMICLALNSPESLSGTFCFERCLPRIIFDMEHDWKSVKRAKQRNDVKCFRVGMAAADSFPKFFGLCIATSIPLFSKKMLVFIDLLEGISSRLDFDKWEK